jgi:uncharacterized protein
MSRENIEIVRRLYRAVARRDTQAVLALYDPEVEWDNSSGALGGGVMGRAVYHGHDGLRRFFREWYDAFEIVEWGVQELSDANQHVISVSTMRARGRASGIVVESTAHALWTLREGKIVRVAWFPTHAEALKAARREQ